MLAGLWFLWLLRWVQGLMQGRGAVGADTWGVDVVPPEKDGRPFYGHVTLLMENGIYILETMNTGRLAEENVTEFLFVLGQARVRGTVQMIINPVAIW